MSGLVLFHLSHDDTGSGSEGTRRQLAESTKERGAVGLQEGRDATHRGLGRPEEWAHVTLTSFNKDKGTCARAITSTKTEW